MRKALILVLVLAVFAGLAMWHYQSRQRFVPPTPVVETQAGLFVDAPVANAVANSPLVVSGHIDGTNRWTGFEGQVGTVRLFDSNGNMLALAILTATTDWMQLPTDFSTTLTFSAPATATGTLVFKNENPSGLPEYEREFSLPVNF